MAMFGSFMDGVTRGMQSPLFLGGVGLLSGGGFQGMNQGIQAGILGDRQRFEQEQQAADRQRQMMMDAETQRRWDVANERAAAMHPLDMRAKVAQINNLNRREEPEIARTLRVFGIDPMSDEGRRIGLSKMGGEAPASVREWNYYNGLNPEQQAAYRQMKRSDKTVDTGTEFVNISNPNATRIAKDVSGAASLKEQGKAQGQAAVELPAVLQRADDALATIEKLRTHPGREWGTGSIGIIPGIPGTHQKDFVELNEQAKGGAFLQAFQLLKGGGAITNIEGDKATKAIARLDRTQTREGYLSALKDLESVIVAGAERARAKARGGATVPQGPQAKIAPAVQVKSVDEAMALQPGTRFMTPDGREKIR